MAELLVKAKPHWKDDFTQARVDAMVKEEKAMYDARSQIGDIIVVRPDGWEWGKEERLPNFVVFKLPGVSVDAVKKYEDPLTVGEFDEVLGRMVDKVLKRRKHQITPNLVKHYKTLSQSAVDVSSVQVTNFIKNSVIIKES